MPNCRNGFTLIELLAALALAALLTAGLARLVVASMDDVKGQRAAFQQAQLAAAASKYVASNRASLLSSATATAPARVTTDDLKTAGLLSEHDAGLNAFGQSPCVLILQPTSGVLEALVVTESGPAGGIPQKDLPAVAADAGPGAGYITYETAPSARGAFGSWSIPPAALSTYLSANCSGVPAGPGSLANALFFDSSGTSADFVYRDEVPGHPELNSMTTPLHMAAVAVEGDVSDPRCAASDPNATGRIAVDAGGRVLSCQGGIWKAQGSGSWKDPVANFSDLPVTGNVQGDVRMVTALSRAFSWNGVAWVALAVDESGNLNAPGTVTANHLQVLATETVDAPCAGEGLVAKDQRGMLLSCQSGAWQTQANTELPFSEIGSQIIMRSDYLSYPPSTVFYAGPYTYDAANDTMIAQVSRTLLPKKDGLIIANVSSSMYRALVGDSGELGQFTLMVQVVDLDSGAVIATTKAMSPLLKDDTASLAATLSKAVLRNVNGYAFQMTLFWTTYKGSAAGAIYDRSNFLNAAGQVIETTPLDLTWSLDMTY